jgi:hypothetical protein
MEISIGKHTRRNVVTQQLRKADDIELDRNSSNRIVTDSQSIMVPSYLSFFTRLLDVGNEKGCETR